MIKDPLEHIKEASLSPTQRQPFSWVRRMQVLGVIALVALLLGSVTVVSAQIPIIIFVFSLLITILFGIRLLLAQNTEAILSGILFRIGAYIVVWIIPILVISNFIMETPTTLTNRILIFACSFIMILILWGASLFLPVWLFEIETGDVFLIFHPFKGRTKYRYESAPLDYPVAQNTLAQNDQQPGNPATLFLGERWIWLAPIERTQLVWHLQRRITISRDTANYDDVYTKNGTPLGVRVKAVFEFDPAGITEKNFAIYLSRVESPDQLHDTLQYILADGLEQAIRRYYIGIDYQHARTSASMQEDGLAKSLETRLSWMKDYLGIQYLSPYTLVALNADVQADKLSREAALASMQTDVELNKIQRLVQLASAGDYQAKLLFALYFMENTNLRLRYFPKLDSVMPKMDDIDRLLASGVDAKQLVDDVRHNQLPAPSDTQPPIPTNPPPTTNTPNDLPPPPPPLKKPKKEPETLDITQLKLRVWHRCEDHSFVFHWENLSQPIRLSWDGNLSEPITNPKGKFDTKKMRVPMAGYEIVNEGKVIAIIEDQVNCAPRR